jgi:hypothetical protein
VIASQTNHFLRGTALDQPLDHLPGGSPAVHIVAKKNVERLGVRPPHEIGVDPPENLVE